jgi:hypothetical protein
MHPVINITTSALPSCSCCYWCQGSSFICPYGQPVQEYRQLHCTEYFITDLDGIIALRSHSDSESLLESERHSVDAWSAGNQRRTD